jgi:hypothetical protein
MVNQTDIADVMRKYPDLTIDGLAGDRRPDFERRRTALSGAVSEFERAVAWLSRVPKRKSANRDGGCSYGLKHAAEGWAGAYLPNGALIAAAVHLGFPIVRCPSAINCWIGVASARKWPSRDNGI